MISALVFALLAATPEHVGDGRLHVQVLDVGQGAAVVVISPTGRVAVFDGAVVDPSADAAARMHTRLSDFVKPPLKPKKGSHPLDLVVITGSTSEELGGLAQVLRESPPTTLVLPSLPPPPGLAQLAQTLKARGTTLAGPSSEALPFDLGGDASVLVVGGGQLGLAARVQYQAVSVWVMGDEPLVEKKVLQMPLPQATLLVATGHGMGEGSQNDFLEAVHPAASIVSCGPNPHGLPNREALDRLAAHSRVFRTDLDGDLVMESDGQHLIVTPQKSTAGYSSVEPITFPAVAKVQAPHHR